MMKATDLLGTTTKAVWSVFDKEETSPFRSYFFKPIKSPSNALFRVTSIVTDSFVLEGLSAFFLLYAGYELLKTVGNVITLDKKSAGESISKVGAAIFISIIMFVAGSVSSVVNTIDLIGGGINTLSTQNNEALPDFSL